MGKFGRGYAMFTVVFWAGLPGFGLIDLSTIFVEGSYYAEVVALEASWGTLFTAVVALAFGYAAVRPRKVGPALVLLWLTTAMLLLAALLGLQWGPAVAAAVLAAMTFVLHWFARRRKRPPTGRKLQAHWPLAALTLAAMPFWLLYAANAFAVSRAGGSPPEYHTMGIDHWPVQGALGLTLAAAGVVLAVWPAGRRLFQISLSLSAATLGIAWLMHPDTLGSVENSLLAAGAVLWAALIALVGQKERD